MSTSDKKFNYGWFDAQRAKEFIPDTQTMLTFSDPVALLKMSKTPSARIRSLERIVVKKREDNMKKSFSDWLVAKVQTEEKLKKEFMIQREKEKESISLQKREREMQARVSYSKWIHVKNSNKSELSLTEELEEISRTSRMNRREENTPTEANLSNIEP